MTTSTQPVGNLLREWRRRRRCSQLDLAVDADISTRHLSFVETGRSVPSREMIMHLAETLRIPFRERNLLLLAAGYAPAFREGKLNDPELEAARKAIDLVLKGHEPYPALAVDRHWNMTALNSSVGYLIKGIDPEMLKPPVNVLRLSLHPQGLAPRILNLYEWRTHLLERLRLQIEATGDPILVDLMRELSAYPVPKEQEQSPGSSRQGNQWKNIVVPLELEIDGVARALFSTTTVFGTPMDVTLSELAIESFFPADAYTAEAFRAMADINHSA
jgi:transcriptional regulator with XRE-family HTH domain